MALPNPIQSYFVPVRESDLIKPGDAEGDFETISEPDSTDDSPIVSLISLSIAAAGTIVVYDHWEDGYELDLTNPQQSTTEIWGDKNLANGAAPGVSGDDFLGGESFVLQSIVPVDRTTEDIRYDGADQISATFPIAVTRAAYPEESGSFIAGATEALDADSYGDVFVMPFGVLTEDDQTNAFQVTSAHIMASAANTPIYVNGTLVATLANAGETFVVKNVEEGDVVRTFDPATADAGNGVQITLVTGDENSGYETRWYSLLPREAWSNDYYTPVFTGEQPWDSDSSSDRGPTDSRPRAARRRRP